MSRVIFYFIFSFWLGFLVAMLAENDPTQMRTASYKYETSTSISVTSGPTHTVTNRAATSRPSIANATSVVPMTDSKPSITEYPPMLSTSSTTSVAAVKQTVTVVSTNGTSAGASVEEAGSQWALPTEAIVVDWFSLPHGQYGAGNRGIRFGVADGDLITAVDSGVVTFAGQVVGENFVTVQHSDSLFSTYGGLSEVSVVEGDNVDRLELIGKSSSSFQLTARNFNQHYIDPADLLGLEVDS